MKGAGVNKGAGTPPQGLMRKLAGHDEDLASEIDEFDDEIIKAQGVIRKAEEEKLKRIEAAKLKKAEEERLMQETYDELVAKESDLVEKAKMYTRKEDIDAAYAEIKALKLLINACLTQLPKDVDTEVKKAKKIGVFELVFGHFISGWVALVLFPILAYVCWLLVGKSGAEILEFNKTVNDASQMIPPSVGKLEEQKLFMSCVKLFLSPVFWLLIMLGLAPDKLLFILPYTKEPIAKWKNFYGLPEKDKQWLAFAWSAGVLLFVAFMLQTVK